MYKAMLQYPNIFFRSDHIAIIQADETKLRERSFYTLATKNTSVKGVIASIQPSLMIFYCFFLIFYIPSTSKSKAKLFSHYILNRVIKFV